MTANRHIEDPHGKKATQAVIWRFMFELCQMGTSGAEGDGLEDTQPTGGTNGQAPHQSV
jgi:hypothetical protein